MIRKNPPAQLVLRLSSSIVIAMNNKISEKFIDRARLELELMYAHRERNMHKRFSPAWVQLQAKCMRLANAIYGMRRLDEDS